LIKNGKITQNQQPQNVCKTTWRKVLLLPYEKAWADVENSGHS